MKRSFLFVYGTLRRGDRNRFAAALQAAGVLRGRTVIAGKLYLCGDESFPYPAATYVPDGVERVVGEVYELHSAEELLVQLDTYEGVGMGFAEPQEYVRRIVQLELAGAPQEAWCYVANHPLDESRRIPSGDFAQAVPPGDP